MIPRCLVLLMAIACGEGPQGSVIVDDSDPQGSDPGPVVAESLIPTTLCINELMVQSDGGWSDETGAFPDWIELYNGSSAPLSLEGFVLTDTPDAPGEPLDPSLVIPAKGYLVLAADGLPELGPTHLPFSLSADGESLGLFQADGGGEILNFGTVEADFSWAREPDCCADIPGCVSQVWQGTPASSNGAR